MSYSDTKNLKKYSSSNIIPIAEVNNGKSNLNKYIVKAYNDQELNTMEYKNALKCD